MGIAAKRAIIYVRISRDHAGEGLGVARQEAECRALCDRKGWEVLEVFTDNDVSASSGKRRPAYEAALGAIEAGHADAFVAWAWDRVTRRPSELDHFVDVVERSKADVALVQAGDVDLATPAGRGFARILGVMARMEVEQKSVRQKSANRQKAMTGMRRKGGGNRIFGWGDDRLTLEPFEAEAIRNGTQAIIEGASVGSVAKAWDEDPRVNTSLGGRWYNASVRQVLLRESNAGLVKYDGQVVPDITGNWESIVSVEDFETVSAILRQPGRRKNSSTRLKHFSSGLVVCGVCESPMGRATASIRGRNYPIFRCRQDEAHSSRLALPIEKAIELEVTERLAQPDAADLFRPVKKSVKRSNVAKIEAIRSRILTAEKDYEDGNLTGLQLKSVTTNLEAQLATEQSLLAESTGSTLPLSLKKVKPSDVQTIWSSLSPEEKRTVADTLLSIRIYPVTDPEYGDLPYGALLEWK